MLSEGQKRLLSWAGGAAGLLGVVFLIFKLVEFRDEIALANIGPSTWLALAGLGLISGLSGILLALAWRELLIHFGETVGRTWAIRVYGTTQLAKYVPGNVVHLAARQAVGVAAGLSGWPLAKATIWELVIFAATASLFLLLALPLAAGGASALGAILFAAALGLCIRIANGRFGAPVARAVGFHATYYLIAGFIFVGVLSQFDPDTVPTALPICGAYVVSTVAGLLTPGAPAGLGIRETVLYALLHASVDQPDLLAAILCGRLVTSTGDLVFYAYASFATSAE